MPVPRATERRAACWISLAGTVTSEPSGIRTVTSAHAASAIWITVHVVWAADWPAAQWAAPMAATVARMRERSTWVC